MSRIVLHEFTGGPAVAAYHHFKDRLKSDFDFLDYSTKGKANIVHLKPGDPPAVMAIGGCLAIASFSEGRTSVAHLLTGKHFNNSRLMSKTLDDLLAHTGNDSDFAAAPVPAGRGSLRRDLLDKIEELLAEKRAQGKPSTAIVGGKHVSPHNVFVGEDRGATIVVVDPRDGKMHVFH